MTPDELNAAKYKLDVKRYLLDRAKIRREHKFLFRHSTVLITGFLSLISVAFTVGVTIKNFADADDKRMADAQETARQKTREEQATSRATLENDRKRSLELLQYLTRNFDAIYSGVPEKQQVIQTALVTAFPIESQRLFKRLAEVAPTKDAPNVWQEEQRSADKEDLARVPHDITLVWGRTTPLAVPTSAELVQRLTGTDRRSAAEALARLTGNDAAVLVDRLTSSLLPQNNAQSYRFNLYAAVVLAKVPGKWRGLLSQRAAVAALRHTGNYKDATFRLWVDAALENYQEGHSAELAPPAAHSPMPR